jgi:molybdopterin converting factor small subunit
VPTIELYGQARLLARTRTVEIVAGTLGDALVELGRRHPELVGPVIEADGRTTPAYAVNINGRRFCSEPNEPVQDGDELLIISSLSGG